ncbi:hypothetical protein B0H16DRAFT_1902201 [Mycena metata]|uniref:Mitochondrial chaperone BCS1-like ATPase lid domain-containing protein n=1 Tax=Mycena metata TaxID=1033252 RepID=A0AAD7M6L3_9AGAR|nr:hypothetical protein B0H16DRAFT_1902201 [Mycena metata]
MLVEVMDPSTLIRLRRFIIDLALAEIAFVFPPNRQRLLTLIRPGRMDLKIQYGLATCDLPELGPSIGCYFFGTSGARPSAPQLAALAKEFAAAIPAGRYSIAQLQGYLLSSKNDPEAALEGMRAWMETQETERRDMEELKQKRRKEAALRRAAEAAAESEVAEAVRRGNGGGENGYQNGRTSQAPTVKLTGMLRKQ